MMIRMKRACGAVIGIVGSMGVGLPLMLRYSHVGFNVLGIDMDPAATSGKVYPA